MSTLEYYHVELDTHEVIYAEGALVESYDGSNPQFFKFRQYERLYGASGMLTATSTTRSGGNGRRQAYGLEVSNHQRHLPRSNQIAVTANYWADAMLVFASSAPNTVLNASGGLHPRTNRWRRDPDVQSLAATDRYRLI